MVWESIEAAISEATGADFRVNSHRAVGGGCVNETLCLEGDERRYFLKLNRVDRISMFEAEAAGLTALRASNTVRTPAPVCHGLDGNRCWLVLEYIDLASPGRRCAALMGKQLAAMHRTSAGAFGWERDNTIGATPQPNTWTGDWMAFLRENRLGFQLDLAQRNGASRRTINRGRLMLERLEDHFQGYQPVASLLHGDLWAGNWAADSEQRPVMFDPAVYFGDRESDIAMTELFGGFSEAFYSAYQAAWPLHPGYCRRKPLYQLYHILNHFNLFGESYVEQAAHMIDSLLDGTR